MNNQKTFTLDPKSLVVAPGEGEKTASDMVMIMRSERMGGHFSIMEGEVRPMELLAFHTHSNEDQHMYIIEGELQFEVGGKRFIAGAGSHVLKPRGISHGFWNLSDTTARYVETSTEAGFERFIDSRQAGLGTMVEGAQLELGMSFEVERALEVMREFELTGLAGANLPDPASLLADPAFRRMMSRKGPHRDLILHIGGAKLKQAVSASLFGS